MPSTHKWTKLLMVVAVVVVVATVIATITMVSTLTVSHAGSAIKSKTAEFNTAREKFLDNELSSDIL